MALNKTRYRLSWWGIYNCRGRCWVTSRHEKVCCKSKYKFFVCKPLSSVFVFHSVQHIAVYDGHVNEVKECPPPPFNHAMCKAVVGEELVGHVNSSHILVVLNNCNWLFHLLSSSRRLLTSLLNWCPSSLWIVVRTMTGLLFIHLITIMDSSTAIALFSPFSTGSLREDGMPRRLERRVPQAPKTNWHKSANNAGEV